MEEEDPVKDIEIQSIVGFDGKLYNALHIHPDGLHIVYPIGNSVTIQNSKTKKQDFLHGHTNLVSAVALSKTGRYVATGQINYMGFKAKVILWDFDTREQLGHYEIHKVRIECIIFTCDESFLISLGGRDDASLVVYDVLNREPVCGANASGSNTGIATTLVATNKNGTCFLTGGDRTLRLWQIDINIRKVAHYDLSFNKIKRIITCMTIDNNDKIGYCGTSSGDVVKIGLAYGEGGDDELHHRKAIMLGVYGKKVMVKKKQSWSQVECYSKGVRAILILGKGHLLIGAGDGTVEELKERDSIEPQDTLTRKVKDPTLPMLVKIRGHNVDSGVSSMKLYGENLLIGTVESEMFSIDIKRWILRLQMTCHTLSIYDICFPSDMSSVFATCSKDTIRVWNTKKSQELLRITLKNMTCSGVVFQHDGKGIVSSWNDGKIRAFTPETGQLMYIIENAHNKGVSAIALTRDGRTIVSGGGEGQVRVWDITPMKQTLRAVLQDHKGPVSAIDINSANDEAASASTDGSCIIWDITICERKNIIFANTQFMAVRYHTSDCQILTAGTNRKISYWESFDGSLIRDMEGSAAAINTIDISPCGQYFLTSGNDQIIKVWKYQQGITTHVGIGHAGIVTQARFSPDGEYIVSVSSDGAMFRWLNPYRNCEEVLKDYFKDIENDTQIAHKEEDELKKLKISDKDVGKETAELDTVRSEPNDVMKSTHREDIRNVCDC